jgi:hypothetical protein
VGMRRSRQERLRAGDGTHEEWRADRDADLRQTEAERNAVVRLPQPIERTEAAFRSAGNSATLGYADNISAFGDAALGLGEGANLGDRYQHNLEQEHVRDRYYEREYPNTSKAAEVIGGLSGLAAAGVGEIGTGVITRFVPGSARAMRAVGTTRVVPFIKEGYGTMGAIGGGLVGGAGQLAADAQRGRRSSLADLGTSIAGGAYAGWQATHGRPVSGAAVGAGGVTATQDLMAGGSFSPMDVLHSAQGGAYLGRLWDLAGAYGSNALPTAMKGALGEAATFAKSWARGEPIPIPMKASRPPARVANAPNEAEPGPQRQINLPRGRYTIADFVTTFGRALESKFGAYARLTPAQKLALARFGESYKVDHWLPKNMGELTAGWFGAPSGQGVSNRPHPTARR